MLYSKLLLKDTTLKNLYKNEFDLDSGIHNFTRIKVNCNNDVSLATIKLLTLRISSTNVLHRIFLLLQIFVLPYWGK